MPVDLSPTFHAFAACASKAASIAVFNFMMITRFNKKNDNYGKTGG
mgnify:FL=1